MDRIGGAAALLGEAVRDVDDPSADGVMHHHLNMGMEQSGDRVRNGLEMGEVLFHCNELTIFQNNSLMDILCRPARGIRRRKAPVWVDAAAFTSDGYVWVADATATICSGDFVTYEDYA